MTSDAMNTETAVLPLPDPALSEAEQSESAPSLRWLPVPGSYRAEAGRCILEISTSAGPLTTLRGRFAVLDNQLTVGEGDSLTALTVEASTASLHTTRPLAGRRLLGGRGLNARNHRIVRFESTAIDAAGRKSLSIPGQLYLRDEPVGICLKTRVVGREADRLLILGVARLSYRALREACSFRLPWSVPADHVRILLAADFR